MQILTNVAVKSRLPTSKCRPLSGVVLTITADEAHGKTLFVPYVTVGKTQLFTDFIPLFLQHDNHYQIIKNKYKAVKGSIPLHSYGVSLAIWDHTVLPATRHK